MQAEQSESGSSGVLPERITGRALLSCSCFCSVVARDCPPPPMTLLLASARVTVPFLLSSAVLLGSLLGPLLDRLFQKGANSLFATVFFLGPVNRNVRTARGAWPRPWRFVM